MRLDNTPEIAGHIHELQKMQKFAAVELKEFYNPTKLFNQSEKVNPLELTNNETTPYENHQDNVATTPHRNQPSYTHSPLPDTSVTLELPPLRPRIDAGVAARLSITAGLLEVRPKDSKNALFSVYHYWVHKNPVTHLDSRINKDGKWQDRWKHLSVRQPNATAYRLAISGFFCLNPCRGAWWNMSSEMERQAGDHFSDGYPATRPTRFWRQKHSRAN